jgi:hypothetical protein
MDKIFHIYGWASEGKPLIRHGTAIMGAALGKKDRTILATLEVGQSFSPMFKTLAGKIAYRVERVK